jgi:hypothetical protein
MRWYRRVQYDGCILVPPNYSCIPPKVSPAQPKVQSSTLSLAQHSPTLSRLRHCLCDGDELSCACCCWSLLWWWWWWWSWLTVVVVVRVTMMLPGKMFAPPGRVVARGWRANGLQMRMTAVAMVVSIVGVALVVDCWF